MLASPPKITLIGLGLIGSSIGRALKKFHLVDSIFGYDINPKIRKRALEIGFIDSIFDTAEEAVQEADIIFLNTPVGSIGTIGKIIAPYLKSGSIVTDVGSVKRRVIEDLAPVIPDNVHFVPAHPISGLEMSGPDYGIAELFQERWCILTPLDNTAASAIQTIRSLWENMGSMIEIMDMERHDFILSITSHIPHLLSYILVDMAINMEHITQSDIIKYSAGGFRDFTRLAASNPILWRDVFMVNSDIVLENLDSFSKHISKMKKIIQEQNAEKLAEIFTHTRIVRHNIIDAKQETQEPNFGRKITEK